MTCRSGKAYLVVPDGVAHVKGIIFQAVLGVNPLLVLLVLHLVLLGFLDHPLDLVLAESTLVIGDDDLVLAACTLGSFVITNMRT